MSAPPDKGALIVRSTEPLNAETPLELLVGSEVTPTELFFVRNHGPVPTIDPDGYRLAVRGLVETPLSLSLDELGGVGDKVSVAATLACAGNRRSELHAFREIPREMLWDAGALGHAVWTGVRLADVLRAAGAAPGAGHVAFTGLDEAQVDGGRTPFGASIPLPKALSSEVLLAWEMNGEPLRPEHGFPLRLVVPGYIGARSVKWLSEVTVQESSSSNYFQARGYRLFPADADGSAQDGTSLELGEFSLTSVACRAEGGSGGTIVVEGYALAGGMRTVARVDVSLDGGRTWTLARLAGPGEPGCWRLWRAEVGASEDVRDVVVRAWDSAANTQPEEVETVWNPRGYMNNAWHRRPVGPSDAG